MATWKAPEAMNKNVIGLHRAMLGRHRRALDQGQQIALDAFARDIAAAAPFARADLVDLVEEDDPVVLDLADRQPHDLVLVDQLVAFLGEQGRIGVLDQQSPLFRAPRATCRKYRRGKSRRSRAPGMFGSSNIGIDGLPDGAISTSISLSSSSPPRNFLRKESRVAALALAPTRASTTAPRPPSCARAATSLRLVFLDQADADLDEIAHDLLDIAADIADFGEFRRLDLEKGRVGEPREAARDLGLAAAGRPDHQDVLWQDLLAHHAFEAQAPPAIAQGDRDGALRVLLADDEAVKLGDDFAGRKIGHATGFPGAGDGRSRANRCFPRRCCVLV